MISGQKFHPISKMENFLNRKMNMINIGDKVTYSNIYNEKRVGEILEVCSDMDSYEEMRLKMAFLITTQRSLLSLFQLNQRI